jgi:hypothetical protein
MTTALSHQSQEHFAPGKRNAAMRAATIVVFWAVAALLAAIVHRTFGAASPVESAVIKVAAIVVIAAAYSRLAAPRASLDHALLTGTSWCCCASPRSSSSPRAPAINGSRSSARRQTADCDACC